MAGLKAFYMGSARSAALEGCLNASRERGVFPVHPAENLAHQLPGFRHPETGRAHLKADATDVERRAGLQRNR